MRLQQGRARNTVALRDLSICWLSFPSQILSICPTAAISCQYGYTVQGEKREFGGKNKRSSLQLQPRPASSFLGEKLIIYGPEQTSSPDLCRQISKVTQSVYFIPFTDKFLGKLISEVDRALGLSDKG